MHRIGVNLPDFRVLIINSKGETWSRGTDKFTFAVCRKRDV